MNVLTFFNSPLLIRRKHLLLSPMSNRFQLTFLNLLKLLDFVFRSIFFQWLLHCLTLKLQDQIYELPNRNVTEVRSSFGLIVPLAQQIEELLGCLLEIGRSLAGRNAETATTPIRVSAPLVLEAHQFPVIFVILLCQISFCFSSSGLLILNNRRINFPVPLQKSITNVVFG